MPPSTAQLVAQLTARMSGQYATEHTALSPLGYWLLVALAGPAVPEAHRAELEEVLGTDVADARRRAEELLGSVHPAVASAAAVWAAPARTTSAFDRWARTLRHVEVGPLPTSREADEWAARHTRGLVERFPVQLDERTAVVLGSAVATDVTWVQPFEVTSPSELGGAFAETVTEALRSAPGHGRGIVDTDSAGLVGVHLAESVGGLVVLSVIAAADVPAASVHAAAAGIAAGVTAGERGRTVDLFDLPLGDGPAWTITEERLSAHAGPPYVSEVVAHLPEWKASASHDLSDAPGMAAVRAAVTAWVGDALDAPQLVEAKQSAVAECSRAGFKAAAVTAMAVRAAASPRTGDALKRTAVIRFNRPYAVLAVARNSAADLEQGWGRVDDLGVPAWDGVPVFSAWVTEPSGVPLG